MRVRAYADGDKVMWDTFVRQSKNGTFLFLREYMDYHRARFQDFSLLVYDDQERLIALLPANRRDDVLVSHGGLTYGGFVTDARMAVGLMLDVFENCFAFLRECGVREIVYKQVPHIYHRLPAAEDSYALFRCGATLYRRDVTTTAIPARKVAWQSRRARAVQKARRQNVQIRVMHAYAAFWKILEWNLQTVHNLKPVHTLSEIEMLAARFPENIKLFGAFLDDELVAGAVIYETETVAHAQYTASSERGRACGALDLLFYELLTQTFYAKPYFDFGVSTEAEGHFLNRGLVEFKEGFGGRTITHDFYRIDLTTA